MSENAIFRYVKDLGCCDACCLRYLGVKHPVAYEKTEEYVKKYSQVEQSNINPSTSEQTSEGEKVPEKVEVSKKASRTDADSETGENGHTDDSPPSKRKKWAVCVSCIGILQEETWPLCFERVKEVLEKKQYDCDTFACALSAPLVTLLREKAITLLLMDAFRGYDARRSLTPLKEAWKWSFGPRVAALVHKTLDSGAVCPLLITVTMEYPDDMDELSPLSVRRGAGGVITRRAVEQALNGLTLSALRSKWPGVVIPGGSLAATCVTVAATHAPAYLAGRYIKLSRNLPQTPWLLNGRRVMDSSVQEIIFGPVASAYNVPECEFESRLKFVSAGREDVDVRCLGTGRPFAVEISDPRRDPTEAQLQSICDSINRDGRVKVKRLSIVQRDDLNQLKKGEETKCKTYEALCLKLTHSDYDLAAGVDPKSTPVVTRDDILRLRTYRHLPHGNDENNGKDEPHGKDEKNKEHEEDGKVEQYGHDEKNGKDEHKEEHEEDGKGKGEKDEEHEEDGKDERDGNESETRVLIKQRTPVRVLHRRSLITRDRRILDIQAALVPGHTQLFTLRVRTQAGTYIKEWAHGELGRSTPALGDAIHARTDLLALDVVGVHLEWCGDV